MLQGGEEREQHPSNTDHTIIIGRPCPPRFDSPSYLQVHSYMCVLFWFVAFTLLAQTVLPTRDHTHTHSHPYYCTALKGERGTAAIDELNGGTPVDEESDEWI